jgi:phosphoribosylanthranilate isomerase
MSAAGYPAGRAAGRPRIKICGIARPEDALAAVDLGADYLGLNFHPPSPRCVEVTAAREIAAAVEGRVPLVGVFVNRPAAEVEATAGAVGLDLVQFSGDEGPAAVAPFAARAIKALRTGGYPGEAALAPFAAVWALLFDARHGALYGGTGLAWEYAAVAPLAAAGRRVFVAGGIGPGNARQAAASGAFGIDVCSGVEKAPGIKDRGLLERLFEEVRHGAPDSLP